MTTDEFKKKNNLENSDQNASQPSEANGSQTEPESKDGEKAGEEKTDEEKNDGRECAAMKQEEIMKQKLLQGAKRLYNKYTDVSQLLAQQIVSFLGKFEGVLKVSGLKLIIRVKLYELLNILVKMDIELINRGICEKGFTDLLVEDYECNDSNSNILNVLNSLIVSICQQESCFELRQKLFKDSQLLFRLAKRLSLSEYSV